MKRTVIVSAKRSPIGRFLGSLARLPAPEIGAQVAKAVLNETKAVSAGVDEVIVGNVLQGGVGQNPARQVALKAGLPPTVTAIASGLSLAPPHFWQGCSDRYPCNLALTYSLVVLFHRLVKFGITPSKRIPYLRALASVVPYIRTS